MKTESQAQEHSVSDSLSNDDLFHLLSNRRRRDVLRYLSAHEGRVDMRDIAERIAAWEHDIEVQNLRSKQRQRVYIALYQSHLPKLSEFGVIEYDRSRGHVERTALAGQLDPYLDLASSNEPDSIDSGVETDRRRSLKNTVSTRALLTGVLGGTVLLAGWVGIVSVGVLLIATWAALVTMAFVGETTELIRQDALSMSE
jgi:hypothetical protein